MIDAIRVPPHNVEAEQSVLGGIMLEPRALEVAAALLTEDDFYQRDHRIIWRAICELDAKGKPFDAVTLGEWFAQHRDAAGIDASYVIELANATPSSARVKAYAQIVREKSIRRLLISAATEAAANAFTSRDTAQEILDTVVGELMRLQRNDTSNEFTMTQANALAYARVADASVNGIGHRAVTTGFTDVDGSVGGFFPGDLVIVGGRPGMGKTALMMSSTRRGAASGAPTGVISGEMSAEQFGSRAQSGESGIEGTKFRTGRLADEEWPRLSSAIARLNALPIFILDRSAPSIADVRRVAERWKKQHGIRTLWIDYLQRITAKGEKRSDVVSAVAAGFKEIARDLDITVIALAQVKREVEGRGNKRPRMADLSDSGEIEKEADSVFFLYRDEYYHADSKAKGTAELILDKNRHGPNGTVRLSWNERSMQFDNHCDDSGEAYGEHRA